MFVTMNDNRVHVTLSRRNLRQLAAMLDDPALRDIGLFRRNDGVALIVRVEDDSEHYGERPMPSRADDVAPFH